MDTSTKRIINKILKEFDYSIDSLCLEIDELRRLFKEDEREITMLENKNWEMGNKIYKLKLRK